MVIPGIIKDEGKRVQARALAYAQFYPCLRGFVKKNKSKMSDIGLKKSISDQGEVVRQLKSNPDTDKVRQKVHNFKKIAKNSLK